jgi:hypothetical protein
MPAHSDSLSAACGSACRSRGRCLTSSCAVAVLELAGVGTGCCLRAWLASAAAGRARASRSSVPSGISRHTSTARRLGADCRNSRRRPRRIRRSARRSGQLEQRILQVGSSRSRCRHLRRVEAAVPAAVVAAAAAAAAGSSQVLSAAQASAAGAAEAGTAVLQPAAKERGQAAAAGAAAEAHAVTTAGASSHDSGSPRGCSLRMPLRDPCDPSAAFPCRLQDHLPPLPLRRLPGEGRQ